MIKRSVSAGSPIRRVEKNFGLSTSYQDINSYSTLSPDEITFIERLENKEEIIDEFLSIFKKYEENSKKTYDNLQMFSETLKKAQESVKFFNKATEQLCSSEEFRVAITNMRKIEEEDPDEFVKHIHNLFV